MNALSDGIELDSSPTEPIAAPTGYVASRDSNRRPLNPGSGDDDP